MFKFLRKKQQETVKVLNVQTLSYSGTTWLNLLLGSHPDVFTLGPPHVVHQAFDDLSKKCLVHRGDCAMWQGFNDQWDRNENFLLALANYTNKKIFVMDNASPDFTKEVLSNPQISVLDARYIRDGRAITASYARKMQDKNVTYRDSILPQAWFYHSFQAVPSLEQLKNSNVLTVHYEQAVKNTPEFLARAGEHLGIEYDEGATRFWEYDHHITSGNVGPISMIKTYQGVNNGNFESKEYYETQLEKLTSNNQSTFEDTRWKSQLSREDLFWFDTLMGEQNELLGYERDSFSDEEREAFINAVQNDSEFIKSLPKKVLKSL